MIRIAKSLLLFCMATGPAALSAASGGFETFAHLPPGEQYRQFSLLLLISSEAGPELVQAMVPEPGNGSPEGQAGGSMARPDDFTTPLVRIVDPQTLLRGAAQLFSFTRENRAQITARMEEIQVQNAVLISMVDTRELMEDAIIIRHAIADSLSFAAQAGDEQLAALVRNYRVHSIFLRNEMEYADFYAELTRLTDNAVSSVGGKMDAYQRMFDDEVEDEAFDRYIRSAENVYRGPADFDLRAAELTEQIMVDIAVSRSGGNP